MDFLHKETQKVMLVPEQRLCDTWQLGIAAFGPDLVTICCAREQVAVAGQQPISYLVELYSTQKICPRSDFNPYCVFIKDGSKVLWKYLVPLHTHFPMYFLLTWPLSPDFEVSTEAIKASWGLTLAHKAFYN